jgi:hypothetical protein
MGTFSNAYVLTCDEYGRASLLCLDQRLRLDIRESQLLRLLEPAMMKEWTLLSPGTGGNMHSLGLRGDDEIWVGSDNAGLLHGARADGKLWDFEGRQENIRSAAATSHTTCSRCASPADTRASPPSRSRRRRRREPSTCSTSPCSARPTPSSATDTGAPATICCTVSSPPKAPAPCSWRRPAGAATARCRRARIPTEPQPQDPEGTTPPACEPLPPEPRSTDLAARRYPAVGGARWQTVHRRPV